MSSIFWLLIELWSGVYNNFLCYIWLTSSLFSNTFWGLESYLIKRCLNYFKISPLLFFSYYLHHGLFFSRINIVFEGIHALEIWRKVFENSSHISSTSSKLHSFSFQFISVRIWLNLTKSVWSYNQISLVNDFDVAFWAFNECNCCIVVAYMSWYFKYIRIITVQSIA